MTPVERKFQEENRTLLGMVTPFHFIFHCHISLRYRYIYYATTKVACTTTLLALQRAELQDSSILPMDLGDVHERNLSPLLKPTQVGPLSKLIESPNYFKFCFVRNPFTRALSCYLEKIAGDPQVHKRHILRQLGRPVDDLSQTVTFEEFLDAVAAQQTQEMNEHWCLQSFHLCWRRIPFDLIGRFESFCNDFDEALSNIGINSNKYFDRQKYNTTGSDVLLKNYYDHRLVSLVRRIYHEDFQNFGYPLDLPS